MAVPDDKPVQSRITCPNCWHSLGLGDVLRISTDPGLVGDHVLGTKAARRFIPTHFDNEGNALDECGKPCHGLACPRCHLEISRAVIELKSVPIAICGASSAEQFRFIASMTLQLREVMPSHFHLNFADPEWQANQPLNESVDQLFLQTQDASEFAVRSGIDDRQLVNLNFGDYDVQLRRPFQFIIQATGIVASSSGSRSRILSLYPIEGEYFRPSGMRPDLETEITSLARAAAVIFLFNPSQHPRIRIALGSTGAGRPPLHVSEPLRQDVMLMGIARRIREFRGLATHQRAPEPCVVVLTNFDSWKSLLGWGRLKPDWILNSLNVEFLQHVSRQLREFLLQYAPEIVTTAEATFSDVMYVPTSDGGDSSALTSGDIKPMWAEVPLLYALHRIAPELIPASMQHAPAEAIRSVLAKRSTPAEDNPPPDSPAHVEATAVETHSSSGAQPSRVLSPARAMEHVEFTVYHPRQIKPSNWYSLLAFVHLGELPADAPPDRPAPEVEVHRRAQQILGAEVNNYKQKSNVSSQPIPREEMLTFIPQGEGLTFNPPSQSFLWVEDIHQIEFRMRATHPDEGVQLLGALSVYLGAILLAEVRFVVRIRGSGLEPTDVPIPQEQASSRPYRKIFASYSHDDLWVVAQFEKYAKVLGDRYLRDWTDLRAGEQWSPRLRELIDEADVFQLFWSSSSSRSAFVEQEWRYALQRQKASFIRPGYWEDPFPVPPVELKPLHFERLPIHDSSTEISAFDTGPAKAIFPGSASKLREPKSVPPDESGPVPNVPSLNFESGLDSSGGGSPTRQWPSESQIGQQSTQFVVERIQAAVLSPVRPSAEKIAELSRDFAISVTAVNQRLLVCGDLLQKGFRNEALKECEQEPRLLELVGLLEFSERRHWDEFVRQFGLSPAPAVRSDVAAMLMDVCASEAKMGSLLHQYRELKLRNAPSCLRLDILRRIVKLDSNPMWNSDLRELEALRHREIEQELHQAMVNSDWTLARKLEEELRSSGWQFPPSQQLERRATEVLEKLRSEIARKGLQSLTKDLELAFVNGDVNRGRIIREEWYRVVHEGGLSHAESMPDSMVTAFEWLRVQDEEERKKAEFESALAKLSNALDKGVGMLELEKQYHAVLEYDRSIPDDLRRRVDARIRIECESNSRSRMKLVLSSIIVAIFLMITVWLAVLSRSK